MVEGTGPMVCVSSARSRRRIDRVGERPIVGKRRSFMALGLGPLGMETVAREWEECPLLLTACHLQRSLPFRSATLARYSGRWSCANASSAVAVRVASLTRLASSCSVKSPSSRSDAWMKP